MSTTGINILWSGKLPRAPAAVLVHPKNEQTRNRSPAVGAHTELFWIQPWEVREKVKMRMSPSTTIIIILCGWVGQREKKTTGEETLSTDKEFGQEGPGQTGRRENRPTVTSPPLALCYHLSFLRLCFPHKVSVELIHSSADSNAKSPNFSNLF